MTREEKAIREIKEHCYFNNLVPVAKEALDMAIKALEQEPVIDKIRTEIKDLDIFYDNDYFSGNRDAMFKCNDVLQVIDKYKAESENKYE